MIWNDPVKGSRRPFLRCSGRRPPSVWRQDGSRISRQRRRSGASTTSHADIRGLNRRPGQSRMTVIRRESTLSRIAGSGVASVPHTEVARSPDRADLYPWPRDRDHRVLGGLFVNFGFIRPLAPFQEDRHSRIAPERRSRGGEGFGMGPPRRPSSLRRSRVAWARCRDGARPRGIRPARGPWRR